LKEIEGPNAGAVYELKDICILGRALDCQVHIRDLTVSRRHARITRQDGRFIVEDLGSGNGTFVNEKGITRHPLQNRDVIKVCSARFEFEEVEQLPASVTMIGAGTSKPQILKTVDANLPFIQQDAAALTSATSPKEILAMATRLKTIYAVSEAISSILDIDELLPQTLNQLFDIFPKAQRAFLMLVEDGGKKLTPKAVKRRSENDAAELTVPRTILQQVLNERQAVLSHDAMEDQRFKQGRSVANFGVRAMMCAPFIWRGEVLGVVYLDSLGIAAFDKPDLELLTGVAGQCAAALGNAKLHDELLKRQRLEQDLHLAERIQQSFLPKRIPEVPRYTFSARYDPAFEVGGDFYDFIQLPEGKFGIVVGDVSGKGVSAALYLARLTRDIRYYALAEPDPATVLKELNRAVGDIGQDDIFVTLLYAVLSPQKDVLALANAGHMPAIVRKSKPQGVKVYDEISGLPLGVLPEADYATESINLTVGDTVFLYTDGLVEAMSPSRKMFGMDRLKKVLSEGPTASNGLLEHTILEVQRHVQEAPQFDDTTVVCIALDESPGAPVLLEHGPKTLPPPRRPTRRGR
jgi:phosphoserine phosphatase RsbU/P